MVVDLVLVAASLGDFDDDVDGGLGRALLVGVLNTQNEFAALIAGLITPALPLWQQVGLRVAIVLLLAVVVGIVESVMARLRMERVAYLLGAAAIMGMLTLILTQAR